MFFPVLQIHIFGNYMHKVISGQPFPFDGVLNRHAFYAIKFLKIMSDIMVRISEGC